MAYNKQTTDLHCLTIEELRVLAAQRMDKQTRDYYNEGADSGSTLAENISAYQKYRIRPRVLRDISVIDTSVNVFGQKISIPIGAASTAMHCLAHPDGEIATARACKAQDTVMGLSSFATQTLEDVKDAIGSTPMALQLYLFEERNHSIELINRAKKAGYKAVLLTVDTPYLGRRNLELRNQFKLPAHLNIANFGSPTDYEEVEEEVKVDGEMPQQIPEKIKRRKPSSAGFHDGKTRVAPTGPITFHTHAANPTLSWEDSIPWLKEVCAPMEVWVKGVAAAEDAHLAVHYGCDGIVVSNHGGRQLNGALATLDALPEVVEAVKGRVPVHVDGGIRHGTDIFKALALGADFVWIGRPTLWGLAYKGEDGVALCLKLLMDEFRLCMSLAGVTKVSDITRDYLVKRDRDGFIHKL